MEWIERFGKDRKPEFSEISEFVASKEWNQLYRFIEGTYSIKPLIEYSCCSGAPGWNVKYRKSSKALCTLYPHDGYFTCLVSIGSKVAAEAELILTSCSTYVQELYKNTSVFNGSRWMMIDVTTEQIRQDVEALLCIRIHPPRKH